MAKRRLVRILAPLALLVAATLVALGGLEIALRLSGRRVHLQSSWMLTNPNLVLDPDVIVIPRRLLESSFYAQPASALIVALGDSFTEGFPVDSPHTYPAVLERLLTRHGVTVTVRNAGMGDSGPDQQLRLLTSRVLRSLHPAIVVWQLYANDVWDTILKPMYRIDGDRLVPLSGRWHPIAIRQHVYDWTPLPAIVKLNSRVFEVVMRAVERLAESPASPDPERLALERIARDLDEFERLADVYGFKPYVLVAPPQSLYLAAREGGAWSTRWDTVDHERLTALLANRPERIDVSLGDAAGDRFFDDGRRDPNPRGERHFDERGYARLALIVARRLRHDGVLAALEGAAARSP